MSGTMRLLSISNGHGEDDIACKILAELRARLPQLQIDAWPMVGKGERYRAAGISTVGPANRLPSEGFGTLSLKAFTRDLRAGFIRVHWRQYQFSRALRGQYPLTLGVGDAIPLAASRIARIPQMFVACAKSAYYVKPDGHMPLERRLMRRNCIDVFPRDPLTARGFATKGVDCTYLGNPMMDGLGDPSERWPDDGDGAGPTVLMLAGSRQDAAENARLLLEAAARFAASAPGGARFLFPLHPSLDPRAAAAVPGWEPCADADPSRLRHAGTGARADLAAGALGPMARSSDIAVGLAGTANEQAIGLGLPLLTLPGAGNQGDAYVRMKMSYFGEAAVAVPRDPGAVAAAMAELLDDPARRAAMAQAGRERMGDPGASAAIADRIAARLEGIGRGAA